MKKLVTWSIVAALVLAALALLDRSCRPTDPELEQVKAEYAEFKRATEAKDALEEQARDRSDAVIAKQNDIIVDSQAREAEKDALIVSQKATIKTLQDAEPVQPELEKEPLVINLRAQIKAITRAFDLSQNVVLEQERQLKALGVPILIGYDVDGKELFRYPEGSVTWALNDKAESWKRQYENERALRIYAEFVSEACQQTGRFERAVNDVEGIGVGVYSAVRYKDPIPLALYAGEKLAVKVWGLFHR